MYYDSRLEDAGGQRALDMRRGQANQKRRPLARPLAAHAEIPHFQVQNRGRSSFARARSARASAAEVQASLRTAGRAFRRARMMARICETVCDVVSGAGCVILAPRARGARSARAAPPVVARSCGARERVVGHCNRLCRSLGLWDCDAFRRQVDAGTACALACSAMRRQCAQLWRWNGVCGWGRYFHAMTCELSAGSCSAARKVNAR